MSKRKQARLPAVPTANGAIARAAYVRASQARIDVGPLLKQAGLTLAQAKNPRARIPVDGQIRFLNLVADRLSDDFLGVHLAEKVDLRELGLLYYVLASSETLGEALRRAARYSTLQNEGAKISCRMGKYLFIKFEYVGVARQPDQHQIEFFITFFLRMCRQLTGRQLMPTHVDFLHYRTKMPREFSGLFGAGIAFGRDCDEIAFPSATAQTPVVSADPYLNSQLVQYFDEALAKRAKKPSSWQLRVENAIAPLLPHGQARIEHIASQLGLSRRTLARRLASEGLTFIKVLDRLRLDLARRYLQERDLPVSEIAWLLGYQETSAFNHAFKRWTGKTPKQVGPQGHSARETKSARLRAQATLESRGNGYSGSI